MKGSFLPAFLFTLLCMALGVVYGLQSDKTLLTVMTLVVVLAIMEISLSFDNAVVNASVLDDMEERWRKIFLTWGILIAVFGMRLVFPIVIVAVTARLNPADVMKMALHEPESYASAISTSHVEVSSFGGMFLLLVFLSFFLNPDKRFHWIGQLEDRFASIGKLESVEIIVALLVLLTMQSLLPAHDRLGALTYGILGVVLFVVVDSLSSLLSPEVAKGFKRSGAMAFVYLEVLDASFSFDGVLGAFAITTDIVIIMLGLAIGAMFVRSLTVYLVEQETLERYAFLEHGAHYAIGALAIIMLATVFLEVHELITGLTGVFLIGLSLLSSIKHRQEVG
ncbi:MAG: DUF475 domain-containing protein [Congregibacter sp.]